MDVQTDGLTLIVEKLRYLFRILMAAKRLCRRNEQILFQKKSLPTYSQTELRIKFLKVEKDLKQKVKAHA